MPLFQPDNSMNLGGRPKGSVGGRAQALMVLDALMADDRNKTKLRSAMQASFDQNPMRFFRQIIMPLLPRDVMLKMGEEGVVKWTSLLTTIRTQASPESTSIEATAFERSAAGDAGAKPALPPPNSST